MLLLQTIPHSCFGEVLLGDFRCLQDRAYIGHVFLKSVGFATNWP